MRLDGFVGDIIGQVIAGGLVALIIWAVSRSRRNHQRRADAALTSLGNELRASRVASRDIYTDGIARDTYITTEEARQQRIHEQLARAEDETRRARRGRSLVGWFFFWGRAHGWLAYFSRAAYWFFLFVWFVFLMAAIATYPNDNYDTFWEGVGGVIAGLLAIAIVGLPAAAFWGLTYTLSRHNLRKRGAGNPRLLLDQQEPPYPHRP